MQSFKRLRPMGFTVVELLLVIAIVTILTAIMLPAVQRSRAQARANRCKNNLKQLALAMHNYHDVHRTFPPAWVTRDPDFDARRGYGWQSFLLPYLDQAPLYNRLDFNEEPSEKDKLLQTSLPVLRCPADSTLPLNKLRGSYATSNYSGNFGNVAIPRWLPDGLSEFWPGRVATPRKTNGIMWVNSRCRIRDVVDGTSNTFLAGERCVSSGAGVWFGVTANNHENDAVTETSHASRINRTLASFSSRHRGGSHFVLCDGSARFVSEKIESRAWADDEEPGTYQKLGARNDGFAVHEF